MQWIAVSFNLSFGLMGGLGGMLARSWLALQAFADAPTASGNLSMLSSVNFGLWLKRRTPLSHLILALAQEEQAMVLGKGAKSKSVKSLDSL